MSCISAARLAPNSSLLSQLKFVANKQAISAMELQLSAEGLSSDLLGKLHDLLTRCRQDQKRLKARGIREIQILERVRQIRTPGKPSTNFELVYKLLCNAAHHNLSSLQAAHFCDEEDKRRFIAFNPITDSLYLICLEEILLALQHSSVAFAECVKPIHLDEWTEMIIGINSKAEAFSLVAGPIDARLAL